MDYFRIFYISLKFGGGLENGGIELIGSCLHLKKNYPTFIENQLLLSTD